MKVKSRGHTLYTWNILFNIVVADDGNANDLDHDKCEDDEHDHSNCENDVNFEDIGFVFENCGSLAIMVAPVFVVLLPRWCCRGQHTRLRCLFALQLSQLRTIRGG